MRVAKAVALVVWGRHLDQVTKHAEQAGDAKQE
jgi:hypothetical protein